MMRRVYVKRAERHYDGLGAYAVTITRRQKGKGPTVGRQMQQLLDLRKKMEGGEAAHEDVQKERSLSAMFLRQYNQGALSAISAQRLGLE
jgi:hypothetical protein